MNKVTRWRWWSFKDQGQYVAFFSEESMAKWYARLFALVARRDEVPTVESVYRLEVTPCEDGGSTEEKPIEWWRKEW